MSEAQADAPAALTVETRRRKPTEVANVAPQPVALQGDGPADALRMIAQAAMMPGMNVETMKALLDMRRELAAENAKKLFTEAMHAAQAEIPPVAKNGTIRLVKDGVDKGSIPFTTFEDVMAVLQPIMETHGFSVTWDTEPREGNGGGAQIIGTLTHKAGHSITSKMFLALDTGPGRGNLQAMGSTITYGRRYVLENLFNVVRKNLDRDGVVMPPEDSPDGLSQAQAMEIEAWLLKTKTDRKAIFDRFQIENLLQLSPAQHAQVLNGLQAKHRKMQETA